MKQPHLPNNKSKSSELMNDDPQQDESDEFFEANSSLHNSDLDLDLDEQKKVLEERSDDGFQIYTGTKGRNSERSYSSTNIADAAVEPSPAKQKNVISNRKGSNDSTQSALTIKDELKKNSKKPSTSSFSKIKFRDRSSTKNSNASSNVVHSDHTSNNIKITDNNSDNLDYFHNTDTNSQDTSTSNNHSLIENSYNGFDNNILDTNNYLLNSLEEQDERASPLLESDDNNIFSTSQNRKGGISFLNVPQQKTSTMSKYRSGKFSTTLTNLLPNISAKLHHSKNKNSADSTSQPTTPSSEGFKVFNEALEHRNGNSNLFNTNPDITSNQQHLDASRKKLQLDVSNIKTNEPIISLSSPTNNSSNEKIQNSVTNGSGSNQKDSVSTKSKLLAIMGSSSSKKQAQLQKQLENEQKAEKAKKLLVSSVSSSSYGKQNMALDECGDAASTHKSQQPIPFPKKNDLLLQTINTNQSGYHQVSHPDTQIFFSRNRTDTISSQITSLSNVPSYSMWNSLPNQDGNLYQYDAASALSSNMIPQQQHVNVVPQAVSSSSAVINWRPRSKSNVSNSMLTDFSYNHAHTASFQSLVNTKQMMVKGFSYIENLDMPLAPIMQDDVEPNSFNWITNYAYAPKINYVNSFLQPTNTICVSNIFSIQKTQNLPNVVNLTSFALASLFLQFGEIVTVKTLYGLNLGLIEFKHVEAAKLAIDSMNGKSISTSIPSEVVFAKIIPLSISLENDPKSRFLLTEQLYNGSLKFLNHGQWTVPTLNGYLPSHKTKNNQHQVNVSHVATHYDNNMSHSNGGNTEVIIESDLCPFELPPADLNKSRDKMATIFNSFEEKNIDEKECIKKAFDNVIEVMNNNTLSTDPTNYGPQPSSTLFGSAEADGKRKIFDSPTLRELRKALDNKTIDILEIEQICVCMLDEIAELCSDYLGNTIIQRIFESSSPLLKNLIVNNCAQYLTSIGVHKNGTWAAQKLITGSSDLVNNKVKIIEGIKPYCLPLFTDQFGNYVIQCCLKYGPPFNNFIYDNIIKNFWEIVKSRFGSRAVRAVLESSNLEETYNNNSAETCRIITKMQLYSITSLVITYCEYLATNSNGTLLLTWLLDTCNISNRLEILSTQLSYSIVPLATHKLASLTLLKLLNQRKDNGSSKNILLSAIFENIESDAKIDLNCNLVKILKDTKGSGTQFILKVLSLSLLDLKFKEKAIVKLHEILVSNDPAFKDVIDSLKRDKKFIEELGLGTATPLNNSFDENVSGGNIKRNRTLSYVFKENGVNANGDETHVRNNSISSNNNAQRKRGYSNSHKANGGNSGSIWE